MKDRSKKLPAKRHRRFWLLIGANLGVVAMAVSLAGATNSLPTIWDRVEFGTDTAPIHGEFLDLETRMDRLDVGLTAAGSIYEREVAPIETVLGFYSQNDTLVRRIALALVREGEAVGIDPRVLTSVLLVENPWLDPSATSSVGAVGLMQVMPFHRGHWACTGEDLTDLDTNICYGARVFENALTRSKGNLDRALLRYNGCVRGTNTPDCHLYPGKVYAAAGRAMVREWLDTEGS